ncbi:phosphatidylinositol 3,4,5-trisphosphate 3-phosphatase TPTE2-like [Hylobates moloch]|uniref:phosphatidylinositol 3,4,5-trisphosphate 3-phosphatase TPTE2-like n=1 Tax=Hylobates moloch TaxID=81572 RepID=UPI001362DD30|nr:phosphatidylinositol 3,4,5-trisphosphate 3-phosphatase TPTE2-like [Hylobates moloch]
MAAAAAGPAASQRFFQSFSDALIDQDPQAALENRYVGYFTQVKHLYNWNLPPRRILFIKGFIIYSIHGVGAGDGSDLKVKIVIEKKVVFSCTYLRNC